MKQLLSWTSPTSVLIRYIGEIRGRDVLLPVESFWVDAIPGLNGLRRRSTLSGQLSFSP